MGHEVCNSGCSFFEDIVPYMYGDLSASETSAFESHLRECSQCIDEFAEVSNARFEVYDWKKIEFEPLATPVFEIPYDLPARVSVLDSIRAAFSRGWAVRSLGFSAMLLVTVLAGSYYLSGDASRDVATVDPPGEPSVPMSQVTPVPVSAASSTNDEEVRKPVETTSRPVQAALPRKAVTLSKPQRVKAPARGAVSAEATEARNPTAPRLNDFADEEDNSLRLAQLFEDLDTRD